MATSTLKILREINDYDQQAIADVLGISQNTYSRLERDSKKLTSEQAKKLSEFYNVSIAEILSEVAPTISFSNNKIDNSNNGYIQVDKDQRQSSATEIASLKEEIAYLRNQNSDLIKALAGRN